MILRTNILLSKFTLAFLLLVPFSVSVSHATMFVPIPMTTQVGEADTIVRGKIGNSYADYGPRNDGAKSIFTYYQLQVSEALKGDAPSSGQIMIREMGGEVNGVGMQVAGSAHFDPGEDVVVFMGPKNPDGSYDLKGLSSGKYNIQTQDDGTENLLGLAQHETMTSLHRIVLQKPGKPVHSPRPSFPPSTVQQPEHSAAPQLQPSTPPPSDEESRPAAKTSIWVFLLAAGLLGWFALRRFLKR
jgi:hypothetical protein